MLSRALFAVLVLIMPRLSAEPLQLGDRVTISAAYATVYAQPKSFKGKIHYPLFSAVGAGNITHFLYNEKLRVIEVDGDWVRVESLEQPVYVTGQKTDTDAWRLCNGWVRAAQLSKISTYPAINAVVQAVWAMAYQDSACTIPINKFSFGSTLQVEQYADVQAVWRVLLHDGTNVFVKKTDATLFGDLATKSETEQRVLVCSNALQLLGGPYCWGGRVAHDPTSTSDITGSDCSAIVNLAYRTIGLVVARNSVSLHRMATPVKLCDALPGDLVFQVFSNKGETRVQHVMLYLGNDLFLGVVGRGKQTGIIIVSSQDVFGCPIGSLDVLSYAYTQAGLDIQLVAGSLLGQQHVILN